MRAPGSAGAGRFRRPPFASHHFEVFATFPGGRTGLVAPNGSGKTTLLKLVAEVLGVAPVLHAIAAVESGDVHG